MKNQARFSFLCKNAYGAALVELAFVIPILLLLVFGAVNFGHAYYVGLEVTNAAHAGAEYGSLNPTDTTGITKAATQIAPNLSNLTILSGCECSDGSSYIASCLPAKPTTCSANVVNRVTVKTSTVYTTLVPWGIIPSKFTLSGTATVRGN